MQSISIIGVGGIGSYLARHLHELQQQNQLAGTTGVFNIKVFDDDEVEQKNLDYQDFEMDDLFQHKADVVSARWGFEGFTMRVSDFNEIIDSDHDVIICCVDNPETRRTLYSQLKDSPAFWIDLRSHGRHIAMYTKSDRNTPETMEETLPAPDMEEQGAGSCQRQADLDAGIIQYGNRIIAAVGVQGLINHLRGEAQTSRFTREF
jgi:molybdopterin/thiamine biosynthesis adenylyltransferase